MSYFAIFIDTSQEKNLYFLSVFLMSNFISFIKV